MFHLAKIRFIPHLLNPQENKLSRGNATGTHSSGSVRDSHPIPFSSLGAGRSAGHQDAVFLITAAKVGEMHRTAKPDRKMFMQLTIDNDSIDN